MYNVYSQQSLFLNKCKHIQMILFLSYKTYLILDLVYKKKKKKHSQISF